MKLTSIKREQHMETQPCSWTISIPETLMDQASNIARSRPDWSDPGIDILEMIIGRLGPVENLRFGGVCRTWRSLRFAHRTHHRSTHLTPMLMHPSFSFVPRRRFLSPTDGRSYNFPLSELLAETCLGSSGSWLIMRGRQLHLFNPFTLQTLKLPYIEEDPLEQAFSYRVPLLALTNPNTPDFAAVIFYPQCIYYLRNGEQGWTTYGYYNVNYYGRVIQATAVKGKFYALTSRGKLARIDVERSPVLVWMEQAGSVEFDKGKEHAYLVESNDSLVVVIVKCQRGVRFVDPVKILVLDEMTWTWEEGEGSVRDRAFFLGPRGSMSVSVGDATSTNTNTVRVYTAGDNSYGFLEVGGGRGRGWLNCVHHGRSAAVWVVPEMMFRDRRPRWWVGVYVIISERVILGMIVGLVVFEMMLLLCPRVLIAMLPHIVMVLIENVLVWGPIWISVCIGCNCFCRTLAR